MKNYIASSTKGAQLFLIISVISTILAFYFYDITATTLLLILLGYFLYGCLGIVITFHRHLTHNSYQTYPILTKIFSVLGCLGGTGSPLAWVAIHINHHLKSDKPNDPHSPLYKGLKIFALDYAHEVDKDTKWRMRHLVTDKFQQFLHRYYFAINIAYSLILFLIGGFYLMVFFHWAPAALTAIMSNVVNYVGHKPSWAGSYKSHKLNDQSSNNWIWAVPSWGESWHNNHHRFPKRSYFGDKWYEIDISGMIINFIKLK
jgi:stearoyl-CoA desaturase (delta-9 desaturase)